MLVNHKLKYIYLDTPKTGSTSVETALMTRGFSFVRREDKNVRHCRNIPAGCEDYTKIATVRNPYTRTLSHWTFNKLIRERLPEFKDFEQFVDWLVELDNQYDTNETNHDICGYFSCSKYLERTGYDIILHQENLQQELNELDFIEQPIQLQSINDSKSLEHIELLTPSVKQKINQYCKNDFEQFNYKEEKI